MRNQFEFAWNRSRSGGIRRRPGWQLVALYYRGVAFGNVDAWDALTTASGSASRIGWTAGAGLAVMVAPRWIVKFEYLHVDLGSANLVDFVPGVPEKVSFRSDLFRLGVSFQFGQPIVQPVQPIYRKY